MLYTFFTRYLQEDSDEEILKNFILSEDIVKELEEIAESLGITETEEVSRAIHFLYLQTKSQKALLLVVP